MVVGEKTGPKPTGSGVDGPCTVLQRNHKSSALIVTKTPSKNAISKYLLTEKVTAIHVIEMSAIQAIV